VQAFFQFPLTLNALHSVTEVSQGGFLWIHSSAISAPWCEKNALAQLIATAV
jgi:hypothetical protein